MSKKVIATVDMDLLFLADIEESIRREQIRPKKPDVNQLFITRIEQEIDRERAARLRVRLTRVESLDLWRNSRNYSMTSAERIAYLKKAYLKRERICWTLNRLILFLSFPETLRAAYPLFKRRRKFLSYREQSRAYMSLRSWLIEARTQEIETIKKERKEKRAEVKRHNQELALNARQRASLDTLL